MSEPALAWRGEKAADRSPARIWGTRKGVAAMTSDSKMAAPLDPAALAERFQTLAIKSQAAVQGFLVNRPDVANIGMGDPAKIGQAFLELTTKLMADPRPVARAQLELWEQSCLLYTSDAADDLLCVDLGGRR